MERNLYCCFECNYNTNTFCNFTRHCITEKHKSTLLDKNIYYTKTPKNEYICVCGTLYKHRQSYYKHKKYCLVIQSNKYREQTPQLPMQIESQTSMQQLQLDEFIRVMKSVIEHLQTQSNQTLACFMEQMKAHNILISNQNQFIQQTAQSATNPTQHHSRSHNNTHSYNTTNTNTTTNTNSNNVNIQFFLNDTCKDALTIQDFTENMKITLDDLDKKKYDSLIELILKHLKPLAIHERPIHCLNSKLRQWVYKDRTQGGNWEYDNGEKIITSTEFVIIRNINKVFEEICPEWKENERLKEKFSQVVYNTTIELSQRERLRLVNELSKNAELTKSIIAEIQSNENMEC
jgi:hypothetical protein